MTLRLLVQLAAIEAIIGGGLRMISTFIPYDPTAGWLEVFYLIIDIALLFGLMGIFLQTLDRVGWTGFVGFVVAATGLASIVGPDTVAFGVDTYQAGTVLISAGMAVLGLQFVRTGVFAQAGWMWLASFTVGLLGMGTGFQVIAVPVAGTLFGAGFVIAGIYVLATPRVPSS